MKALLKSPRRRSDSRGRALLVTQWFPPEPAAQAARVARVLCHAGFDTEVVTGIPNYPSGTVADGYRATSVMTEFVDGVRVHRSPLYPSHDASAARRILNYVSWAISASVVSLRHFRNARVAVVYASPATAALPAMIARRVFGTPFVLLVQDVWPDSVFSSGFLPGRLGRVAKWALTKFVGAAYNASSHVVVIAPGMVDLLADRGVPRSKITLIYNSIDATLDEVKPSVSRESLGIGPDAFVLMYAGNHGAAQALDVLIRAVGSSDRKRDCHLVLVGDGVEKSRLHDLANTVAPRVVHFVDPHPREAVPRLMKMADVQVLSLADNPLFESTIPSKLQGIMAAGEPLLALASGDVARVVAEARCGIVSAPGDVSQAQEAIGRVAGLSAAKLEEMGSNGAAYYRLHMKEAVNTERWALILAPFASQGTEEC